uniref:5-hydroxytryptamine receptor 2A n=1 Tax=Neogobius melanostomus TaxID=47308 RepID=A0A8C6WFE4_9GOBI
MLTDYTGPVLALPTVFSKIIRVNNNIPICSFRDTFIRGGNKLSCPALMTCNTHSSSVRISMPIPVLGLRDHSKVFKDGSCFLTDDSFVLVGSFVAFFVPLTIMVVTYFLTIHALQTEATMCLDQLVPRPKWSTTFTPSFLPQASTISSEKLFRRSISRETRSNSVSGSLFGRRSMQTISNEQKASKVLGIVFFLFVIMWCPFFITNVLVVVCDSEICEPNLMAGLLNVFVWVGYLSSAVNPLVYTLFNKTYRAAFLRYVRCGTSRRRSRCITNPPPPSRASASEPQIGKSQQKRGVAWRTKSGGRGEGREGSGSVIDRPESSDFYLLQLVNKV